MERFVVIKGLTCPGSRVAANANAEPTRPNEFERVVITAAERPGDLSDRVEKILRCTREPLIASRARNDNSNRKSEYPNPEDLTALAKRYVPERHKECGCTGGKPVAESMMHWLHVGDHLLIQDKFAVQPDGHGARHLDINVPPLGLINLNTGCRYRRPVLRSETKLAPINITVASSVLSHPNSNNFLSLTPPHNRAVLDNLRSNLGRVNQGLLCKLLLESTDIGTIGEYPPSTLSPRTTVSLQENIEIFGGGAPGRAFEPVTDITFAIN